MECCKGCSKHCSERYQIRGAVRMERDAGYREKSDESGKGRCAVYLG